MRRGELLGLKWMDVDLASRRLYLRETKNGSLSVLVLNDLAVMVIENLPQGAPSDVVLAGVDGEKPSVYTRRLFQGLGIRDAPQLAASCGRELLGNAGRRPLRDNCSGTRRRGRLSTTRTCRPNTWWERLGNLNETSIARLSAGGFTPCAVVETSAGNFQAWLKQSRMFPKLLGTVQRRGPD